MALVDHGQIEERIEQLIREHVDKAELHRRVALQILAAAYPWFDPTVMSYNANTQHILQEVPDPPTKEGDE